MERRLALLALLLACLPLPAAPRQPPHYSDSASLDPFALFDDYDSLELYSTPKSRTASTPKKTPPKRITPKRRTTPKPGAKTTPKTKVPKVNRTRTVVNNNKNIKGENKKNVLKTTTINIESHTNFVMTTHKPDKQKFVVVDSQFRVPVIDYKDPYGWLEEPEEIVHVQAKRPMFALHRPEAPWARYPPLRRQPTTRHPPTTREPSTTLRPSTTRRLTTSTRQPSTTKRSKPKTTKAPRKKLSATRRPTKTEFIASYFNDYKLKKTSNKPPESPGIFKRLYDWIWGSRPSWFSGWFSSAPEAVTTTTTEVPVMTSTGDWFQAMLEYEDSDVHTNPNKQPNKKPMKKTYKGYQLLRAYPDVKWKVNELLDLQEEAQGSGILWWTAPSLNGTTDVLIPPDLIEDVRDHLKSSNIEYDVVIWDLQKAITYENPRLSKKQRLQLEKVHGHPMTWRRYHRYADILRYLEYLQHSYTELVELMPLGRSSEGLPLVAVKISLPTNETQMKGQSNKNKKKYKLRSRLKPAVWLDGGAHAREWIAPAVATWMLHALVEGEKDEGADYELLKQTDFYIMPVLNPDGYEHTHTHDRMWKKTRSQSRAETDDFLSWFPWNWGRTECVGVDTDRNWDYHWNEKDSSRDPCAENYAGPHPFSEPETRAVSQFLAERTGQIKLYLTLHAYSQSWVLANSPAHALYDDVSEIMEMGKLATAALADVYGTKYQIGTMSDIWQPASGMSHDWAKARAGIKYSYHVDLRDSFGPYGFLLPGSQILPTARETWQAVKAMVDNISPGTK